MVFNRLKKVSFSLIELLIVTAILTVLASLLQPSLLKTFQQAALVKCSFNLKTLGLGHQGYMDDNDDYFLSVDFANAMVTEYYRIRLPNGTTVHDRFNHSPGGYLVPYIGEKGTSTYTCPGFEFDETSPFYNIVRHSGLQTYRGFRSSNLGITKRNDFVFPQNNVGAPGPGYLANKSVKPITWDFVRTVTNSYWFDIGQSVVHGNTGYIPLLFSDGHVNSNCFFPLTEWSKYNWQFDETYFEEWYN